MDGGFFRFDSVPDLPREPESRPARSLDAPFSSEAEPELVVDDVRHAAIPPDAIPASLLDDPRIVAAEKMDLSFAEPDGRGGVTVHRSVVDAEKGPLVITGARGLQLGNDNHQENNHVFMVRSPTVAVDEMLEDNPGLRGPLARVAEHPHSPLAHLALRRALRGADSLCSGGRIESQRLEGKKVRRIPFSSDTGRLVVENSEGVQVGDGGTQHNGFKYQVRGAQLSLETLIANDWRFAASFATALVNPDTEAAQRTVVRDLGRAVGRTAGEIGEVKELYDSLSSPLDQPHAVQAGVGNTRRDKAVLDAKGFVLQGWEEATGRERERQRRADDERLQRESRERMAASSQAPAAETSEETGEPPQYALETLVQAASAMALSHLAPDRGYLIDRMTTVITSALVNVQPADALPPAVTRTALSEGTILTDNRADRSPDVQLVPLARVKSGRQVDPPDPTATAPIAPSPPRDAALGAVIWGPLPSVSDGADSPLSRAQELVDYLRRCLWADRADNRPESIARALRARKSLRAVLFLDPAAGQGLWVDVGPVGRAVAALLIRLDLSAELPGRFAVYGSAKYPLAHSVISTTRP